MTVFMIILTVFVIAMYVALYLQRSAISTLSREIMCLNTEFYESEDDFLDYKSKNHSDHVKIDRELQKHGQHLDTLIGYNEKLNESIYKVRVGLKDLHEFTHRHMSSMHSSIATMQEDVISLNADYELVHDKLVELNTLVGIIDVCHDAQNDVVSAISEQMDKMNIPKKEEVKVKQQKIVH